MTDSTEDRLSDLPTVGETWNGRARMASDEKGRPSRRFLEAAAADLLHALPDPVAVARLAAALAEAHETSTPTGGTAVTSARSCEPATLVGRVHLENSGFSAHVVVELTQRHLEPDAALELAAALVVHAAAAHAVRDLERGFPAVSWSGDDRGPARYVAG